MRALVVAVPPERAELVADALWAAGGRGVEERAAGPGTVELRTVLGADPAALAALARSLPGSTEWWIEEIDATPSSAWREHAVAVEVVPGLVVAPAWVADPRVRRPGGRTGRGTTVISIEPGAAFGLGDHPTTRRTLALLAGALDRRPGARVADIGCGSGVLAVAAAVLGARRVRAVDVSPAAVEATIDNARRNGVADRIVVDDVAVGELLGPFDVVVANILAPTLVALADELRRLVGDGGTLIVSGVLTGRYAHVLAALEPLRVTAVSDEEGWAAVALRSPPSAPAR